MTDATYHGDSQDIRVRPIGGEGAGEGPWYASGTCGYVLAPEAVSGDDLLIWASALPTIGGGSAGTGTLSTLIPGHVYILHVTGTGEIELDSGDANGILAHLLGGLATTDCT